MSWQGDRLRYLRKKKGLTQLELGKKLGKAMSTISGYETDNAEPDIDTIIDMAKILDTTVEFFLGVSKEPYLKVYNYDDLPSIIKDAGIEDLRIFKNTDLKQLTLEELEDLIQIAKKIKEREKKENK
jgi:transcriptional regulator with XRE-family HTH domain